jgi:hypothetical protein
MQTARVTILMSPERKAAIERSAAQLGVSSGEFIRLAVDNFNPDQRTAPELAALVSEVNALLPRIRASLDRSAERLEATHGRVDRLLRDMGVRA